MRNQEMSVFNLKDYEVRCNLILCSRNIIGFLVIKYLSNITKVECGGFHNVMLFFFRIKYQDIITHLKRKRWLLYLESGTGSLSGLLKIASRVNRKMTRGPCQKLYFNFSSSKCFPIFVLSLVVTLRTLHFHFPI